MTPLVSYDANIGVIWHQHMNQWYYMTKKIMLHLISIVWS